MSLYLSRLMLNPRSRQVISELAHPYEIHRTLLRAFPDLNEGGPGRVLFRVDVQRDNDLVLLVQSEKQPDWSPIDGIPSYLLQPAEFKSFAPVFATGQMLAFRLRANPTVKKKDSGQRLGLLKEEEQEAWLRRKGERGGFTVRRLLIVPEGFVSGKKTDAHGTHELKHYAVRFEGILAITEATTFVETMESGIGSAKAFGFGLLSVAKMTE